jgi:hypothetical protein
MAIVSRAELENAALGTVQGVDVDFIEEAQGNQDALGKVKMRPD